MNIGTNIRAKREQEGLDQAELAERVNISQAMVSFIEAGRKLPSVALLSDIAKVLHCTMDELAREKGYVYPKEEIERR